MPRQFYGKFDYKSPIFLKNYRQKVRFFRFQDFHSFYKLYFWTGFLNFENEEVVNFCVRLSIYKYVLLPN